MEHKLRRINVCKQFNDNQMKKRRNKQNLNKEFFPHFSLTETIFTQLTEQKTTNEKYSLYLFASDIEKSRQ